MTPSGLARWTDANEAATGTYTPGTPILANSSNSLFVDSDGPGSCDPNATGPLMQFAVNSGTLSPAHTTTHYSAAFQE